MRPRGHKYRVFVQDVGQTGYSGYADAIAWTGAEAVRKMKRPDLDGKLIAIRHSDKHLWPDGKTGQLPGIQKVLRSEVFHGKRKYGS